MEQMERRSYAPNQETLEGLHEVSLIAVVGPTAAGKTTIMRAAEKVDETMQVVVGVTDRQMRPGEKDGYDYRFVSTDEMQTRVAAGEYVQFAPSVTGDLYASDLESYAPPGKVTLMAVMAGALPAFRELPFKQLRTVVMLPPSWEAWRERLNQHPLPSHKLAARLAEAQESFAFAAVAPGVLFVINDDLDTATADFLRIANGEDLTERQLADQARGRRLASDLYGEVTVHQITNWSNDA